MASKSMKPAAPVRREPTPEEKQQAILRALAQKRESFALSAFAGICRAEGMQHRPTEVAAWAIDAADALMEKLYPVTEKPAE